MINNIRWIREKYLYNKLGYDGEIIEYFTLGTPSLQFCIDGSWFNVKEELIEIDKRTYEPTKVSCEEQPKVPPLPEYPITAIG